MLTTSLINQYFPTLHEEELLASIIAVAKEKKVVEGEKLMQIGQYIKWIPLVISGTLRISREDENGRELLLYYLEGGHTCAMSLTCCMQAETSNIKAVAETDAHLIMVPVQYMDEWMAKYYSWKNFVMRSYGHRFEEMIKALDALAFQKMDERLLNYLKEKSKVLKTMELSITHQEIAYSLNSSREVVSRLLKKMENKGYIRLGRNRIELL